MTRFLRTVEHKITLAVLKEVSDAELAEMFKQIGPRKAVKRFLDELRTLEKLGDGEKKSVLQQSLAYLEGSMVRDFMTN